MLIVNLGTPDATDTAVDAALSEGILSDGRVIENQGLNWRLVLNVIILTLRPRRKGRDYEKIWNRERNKSPLKTITRSQAEKLRADARAVDPAHHGRLGDALRQSVDGGAASRRWPRPAATASCSCRSIRNMPRRPRATVCDKAFRTLIKMRWQPAVRVAPP